MKRELTESELEKVGAGYSSYDLSHDDELKEQLANNSNSDEFSLDELENVFAGIPKEALSEKMSEERVRLLNLRGQVVEQINAQEQKNSFGRR